MAKDADIRILRIGIIQGGRIIEERLIRKRDTVSIGSGSGATFSIPMTNLPKDYPLFVMKGGQYHLSFTDAMAGSVTVKDAALDFNSIKAQKLAKKTGDSYHYPMPTDSRGKVVLGDVTVLFQFVIPPPEPPKPQLPELAKGYWFKKIDKPYAATLGATFLAHVGFIMAIQAAPLPKEPTFDEIPNRILKMILPEKTVEETRPDEGGGDEADLEDVKEVKETKKESKGGGEAAKGMGRQTAAEVKSKVMGTGILKVIGSLGTGSEGGALADVLKGGGGSASLEGALSGIGTIGYATSEGQATRLGAGGSGDGAATIGELGTAAATGKVGGGGVGEVKKEAKITGAISAMAPEVDGSLDSGKIASVVKSRIRSVQDCYEKELKKNPKLGGKITIRFTIGEDGKVSEARTESDSMGNPAVADCILSRLRHWRFPKPEGGNVTVSYPFVFAPSGG
jgi:TonB family protein